MHFEVDKLSDDLPLFPDHAGVVPKKAGVVKGMERTLGGLGFATEDGAGKRRYGGHSMRVTGARYWTTIGLEVFKVQIFARWGSSVILRYVADAPLANLTGDLTARPVGGTASVLPTVSRLSSLLEQHVVTATNQVRALEAEVVRLGNIVQPTFVCNTVSNTLHRVLTGGTAVPHAQWRATCGWWYGRGAYHLTADASEGTKLCDRCFAHTATRMSSGSSSSSS